MFGENTTPHEVGAIPGLTEEEERVAFHRKTIAQRSAIVFAGPAANFILAIVIFAGLFMLVGQPFTSPEIGRVQEGSAAERAGLRSGDRILEIDGRRIERFEDVQQIVVLNVGETLDISVDRDGEVLRIPATPDMVERVDRSGNVHKLGVLGVTSRGRDHVRHDPVTAIWRAGLETTRLAVGTLQALGQVISGHRDTKELGGPIKIAQLSHDFAQVSPDSLVWLIALLSINLGLLNLFPVPMLDGGHLLFYGIEALLGRPLGEVVAKEPQGMRHLADLITSALGDLDVQNAARDRIRGTCKPRQRPGYAADHHERSGKTGDAAKGDRDPGHAHRALRALERGRPARLRLGLEPGDKAVKRFVDGAYVISRLGHGRPRSRR